MKVNLRSVWCARLTAATVVAFGLATWAGAQTVLIDLGNESSFRGASVTNPDSGGSYWNSVWAGAYYPDILDIDGNASAIDFGFSLDGGNDSYNGPAGVTSIPPTPAEIAATDIDASALGLLEGALEGPFDFYVSSRFEIQGLDPAKTYNLTFFGSHKFNDNNTTRYTVYTDNTYTTAVGSADLLVGVDDAHNRDTVARINGLAPQTSNILYVGFGGAGGGNGYLNALQIDVVPEPGCLALAAGACGAAASVRRRRPTAARVV